MLASQTQICFVLIINIVPLLFSALLLELCVRPTVMYCMGLNINIVTRFSSDRLNKTNMNYNCVQAVFGLELSFAIGSQHR